MIQDYGFCHIHYPLSHCMTYRNNPMYCVQCPHWDVEFSHFCDKCGEELEEDDVFSPTSPELCRNCRKGGENNGRT